MWFQGVRVGQEGRISKALEWGAGLGDQASWHMSKRELNRSGSIRGKRMRAFCNRDGLLRAFAHGQWCVPARSPKPILQNVKLIADEEDGSVLMGTDLEVGIRHRVLGVRIEQPGAVILPTVHIGLDPADQRRRRAGDHHQRRPPAGTRSACRVHAADRGCQPVSRGTRFRCHQLSCDPGEQPEEVDSPDHFRHGPGKCPLRTGRCAGRAHARVDRDGRDRWPPPGPDGCTGRGRK